MYEQPSVVTRQFAMKELIAWEVKVIWPITANFLRQYYVKALLWNGNILYRWIALSPFIFRSTIDKAGGVLFIIYSIPCVCIYILWFTGGGLHWTNLFLFMTGWGREIMSDLVCLDFFQVGLSLDIICGWDYSQLKFLLYFPLGDQVYLLKLWSFYSIQQSFGGS